MTSTAVILIDAGPDLTGPGRRDHIASGFVCGGVTVVSVTVEGPLRVR
jgi:hypothetical protein